MRRYGRLEAVLVSAGDLAALNLHHLANPFSGNGLMWALIAELPVSAFPMTCGALAEERTRVQPFEDDKTSRSLRRCEMTTKAVQSQKGPSPEAATMGALVMRGIGKVGFLEEPAPKDPGLAGAIIKTTNALVCTSDTYTLAGAIGDRKDLTLGHEGVGIVYKLGHDVKSVRQGDRVAVNANAPVINGRITCGDTLRNAPGSSADGNLPISKTAFLRSIST